MPDKHTNAAYASKITWRSVQRFLWLGLHLIKLSSGRFLTSTDFAVVLKRMICSESICIFPLGGLVLTMHHGKAGHSTEGFLYAFTSPANKQLQSSDRIEPRPPLRRDSHTFKHMRIQVGKCPFIWVQCLQTIRVWRLYLFSNLLT